MKPDLPLIPIANLAIAFLPVLVIFVVLYRWAHDVRTPIVGVIRMLIQLLLVGSVLAFIIEQNDAALVIAVLAVMLMAASWISLGPVKEMRRQMLAKAFISISLAGVTVLALVTQFVLELESWFSPREVIPLAGMIFANAMNAVSLAADRFDAEMRNGHSYIEARRIAFRASLIPITNTLFAVGIVSIPGMMTGQILANKPPEVAARYQIMVMAMVFGSAGIAAACFLQMLKSYRPGQEIDGAGTTPGEL